MRRSPTDTRKLLGLRGALELSGGDAADLYAQHVNPSLLELYRLLGTDRLEISGARGAEIYLRDGRTLIDFSSSFGVTSLGHEHPRVRAAQERLRERGSIDVLKIGPAPLQAALAHDLAALLPAPLEISFFGTSGAEAVEAALKLAERARGRKRSRYLVLTGSFHGKTHSTLALTSAGEFGRGCLPGLPRECVTVLPFGDLAALEREMERGGVIALVVETLQGQSLRECPPGYLRAAAEICRCEGALLIADEVKVGLYRTGDLWSFERHGIVPDVVAIGKGLGGGRHALSAMVTSREIFERAYGSRASAALHSSSMGGLSEACAVALEVLSLYAEPEFGAAVRERSAALDRALSSLASEHPRRVRGLRGRGLARGIELDFGPAILRRAASLGGRSSAQKLDALAMASFVRSLRDDHDVLAHFCDTDPTILHAMPPLVIEDEHIRAFVRGVREVLEKGFARALFKLSSASLL